MGGKSQSPQDELKYLGAAAQYRSSQFSFLSRSGTWVNNTPATTPFGLKSLTIRGAPFWGTPEGTPRDWTWDLQRVTEPGFLTKGDHNAAVDSWSGMAVPVSRIVGKARGEIPWFGLIKLTLFPGATGCCPNGWGDPRAPANSWDSLAIALVVIVAGPFAADFGISKFLDWRKRKKEGEAPVEEPEQTEPQPSPETLVNPEPQESPGESGPKDGNQTASSEPEGDGPAGR